MATLLSNLAVETAIAALIAAFGAVLSSIANYFNARTRYLEQQMQIAQLQRTTQDISAVQHAQQAAQVAVATHMPASVAADATSQQPT